MRYEMTFLFDDYTSTTIDDNSLPNLLLEANYRIVGTKSTIGMMIFDREQKETIFRWFRD